MQKCLLSLVQASTTGMKNGDTAADKYFGCTTVLTSQHERIHDDNVSNEVHCSPSDRIALIKKALILSMRSNLWTVHGHSTLHQILALNYDSDRHW